MSVQMQYDQWCFAGFGISSTKYECLNELKGKLKSELIEGIGRVQKNAQLFCQSPLSFEQKIKHFEALDLEFDSFESMLFLLKVEYPNDDFTECQTRLNEAENLLVKSTSQFVTTLLNTPSKTLPLWGQCLQEEHNRPDQENALIHASLPLIEPVNGYIEQLQCRIKADPIEMNGYPKTFNQVCVNLPRLKQEKVLEGDVSINTHLRQSDELFNRSTAYFNSIMPLSVQRKKLGLNDLRAIQRQPWCDFYISITEAVHFIERQFSYYDERFKDRVINAFSEGRIRVVADSSAPSFCFDTPKGSFIQVAFVGDLESFSLLAHECGHLIHQELIRQRWVLRQDIQACLTESIAMYFENRIVKDRLEAEHNKSVLKAWLERQYNEWVNRHQLFELFELGLYQLDCVNPDTMVHLWIALNRRYYPVNILFDQAFECNGFKTPHLYFSPFYHSVYPPAYLFSLGIIHTRLKDLINRLSFD